MEPRISPSRSWSEVTPWTWVCRPWVCPCQDKEGGPASYSAWHRRSLAGVWGRKALCHGRGLWRFVEGNSVWLPLVLFELSSRSCWEKLARISWTPADRGLLHQEQGWLPLPAESDLWHPRLLSCPQVLRWHIWPHWKTTPEANAQENRGFSLSHLLLFPQWLEPSLAHTRQ